MSDCETRELVSGELLLALGARMLGSLASQEPEACAGCLVLLPMKARPSGEEDADLLLLLYFPFYLRAHTLGPSGP